LNCLYATSSPLEQLSSIGLFLISQAIHFKQFNGTHRAGFATLGLRTV
jgi:hypothetical protein